MADGGVAPGPFGGAFGVARIGVAEIVGANLRADPLAVGIAVRGAGRRQNAAGKIPICRAFGAARVENGKVVAPKRSNIHRAKIRAVSFQNGETGGRVIDVVVLDHAAQAVAQPVRLTIIQRAFRLPARDAFGLAGGWLAPIIGRRPVAGFLTSDADARARPAFDGFAQHAAADAPEQSAVQSPLPLAPAAAPRFEGRGGWPLGLDAWQVARLAVSIVRSARQHLDTIHQCAGGGEPGFVALGVKQTLELGFDGSQFAAFVPGLLAFDGEVAAIEPGVALEPFEKVGGHGRKETKRL